MVSYGKGYWRFSGAPMVVGSQARILYSDQQGRVGIALAFNKAVANGVVKVRKGT